MSAARACALAAGGMQRGVMPPSFWNSKSWSVWSMHLKKPPLSMDTPSNAKIRKKRELKTERFRSSGRDEAMVFTTTLRFSLREISRKGRSTLAMRKILMWEKTLSSTLPKLCCSTSARETVTMEASKMFQEVCRYAGLLGRPQSTPKAAILMNISMVNTIVKTRLAHLNTTSSVPSGSCKGFWSIISPDDIVMSVMMTWSNHGARARKMQKCRRGCASSKMKQLRRRTAPKCLDLCVPSGSRARRSGTSMAAFGLAVRLRCALRCFCGCRERRGSLPIVLLR
mmetsp:Transcript_35112/g.100298  ORF Transcript_35112/g.100298 Transcript_35112/m.100298 type:complete len:283 (-) Transcript_35112:82-930(-)